MKIQLDKEYMKKIKYITLGFVIIYVIYQVITNLSFLLTGFMNGLSYILNILSPLIWGCVIAFILLPLVKLCEKLLAKIRFFKRDKELSHNGIKTRRFISVMLTMLFLIGILALLIYSIYVMIGGTFQNFSIDDIIEYTQNNIQQYLNIFSETKNKLIELGIPTEQVEFINDISSNITNYAKNIMANIATGAGDIGKGIISFFFGFIFAVNIIIYREYFSALIENFLRLTLKDNNKKVLKEIFVEINEVLLRFVRAQVIDLSLLGLVTSFALQIAGFQFPYMVGLFAGYTNIIPYLGSWLGALPIIFVSLADGGLQKGIIGYILILVVQQIYITFVTPKIQGDNVGIHPMFALLSLTVFGSIFGLLGMVLAIPLAGIIRIFVLRIVKYRKNKKDIELVYLDYKK